MVLEIWVGSGVWFGIRQKFRRFWDSRLIFLPRAVFSNLVGFVVLVFKVYLFGLNLGNFLF